MNDSCRLAILELQNSESHPPITAKKGDTGRKLQFLLTDHGTPYEISSDCYAVFTAEKPDGAILYNACVIEDGLISYVFTPQTCAAAGNIPCEVKLYGADGKLITSPRFTLTVEDTVYSEGDPVESAAEVSALTDLISTAAAVIYDANELISDVEQKLADNAYAAAHSAVCYTAQDLTGTQKSQARLNISAAPSGYGLGEARTTKKAVSSCSEITAGGVWLLPAALSPDEESGEWECAALPNYYGNGMVLLAVRSCQTMVQLAARQMYGGTWGEWEWINPPMVPGVEYRTTERWQGKAVYTKLISCGTMPNCANVNISGLTPGMNILDYSVVLMKSGVTNKLPSIDASGNVTARAYCFQGSSVIQIQALADMSSWTAYATIKYTLD